MLLVNKLYLLIHRSTRKAKDSSWEVQGGGQQAASELQEFSWGFWILPCRT